jgi:hypothetical protein
MVCQSEFCSIAGMGRTLGWGLWPLRHSGTFWEVGHLEGLFPCQGYDTWKSQEPVASPGTATQRVCRCPTLGIAHSWS